MVMSGSVFILYDGVMVTVIAAVVVVLAGDRYHKLNRTKTQHTWRSLTCPHLPSSRLSAASGCPLFVFPAALVYLKL